ncbi:MAG: type II toxin-antitoxin system RelE/ParE family toxin [Gemmatimonadetes bacterium]|nr:type II toxin-antitoxin system RelE/ParE family toxin [Gemmatimonadota bacterium]
MTVIWSRQAQDDLAAIRKFIARDSERYAQLTVERLIAATDRLEGWPRSGRVVPEVGDENLREVLFGLYRIVYRLQDDSIGIVTIAHMARELRLPEDAA